tara:strand:- start:521 stop:898 length:378 start_codon:yes stop_codon:yes gene_type:complete
MIIKTKNKDHEIKARIRKLILSRGMTATSFAREMHLNPPYFVSMLNSKEKGISATIYKALQKIGVNINWLISGEGNMSLVDEFGGISKSWKNRALESEKKIMAYERDIDNLNFLIKNLERMIQER